MSHFSVMVIGKNPEMQLEKFAEDIQIEEYCKGEVSESNKKEMLEYYNSEGNNFNSFDQCYQQFGKDWNDNNYRKDENGIWQSYSTYNLDAKWDWFTLGGRWHNFYIILKPEVVNYVNQCECKNYPDGRKRANQALKKDIDFDAIYQISFEKATKTYREIKEKCGGEIPELSITPDKLNEGKYSKLTIEEYRELYNSQESVQLWKKAGLLTPFGIQLEDVQCTEEEFAHRCADGAFSTFAYVRRGNWYEQGRMGWFGISTDNVSQESWNQQIKKMLQDVSGDTLISIYDCHI
jgi:hypothetical protein